MYIAFAVSLTLIIVATGYVALIVSTAGRPSIARTFEPLAKIGMAIPAFVAVAMLVGFFCIIGYSAGTLFAWHVSIIEFLFGTVWDTGSMILLKKFDGSFGTVGLFWGTAYIATIAMLVAWPIGYATMLYAIGKPELQLRIRSRCQILIVIPSIVWGLFAVLIVSPIIRSVFPDAHGNNALTAGIAMGFMLAPWVTYIILGDVRLIPRGQWEAAYALGLDTRQAYALVIRPQANAAIWVAIVSTASKAMTETMIVLLAAGLRPQITLNPLDEMTTVTVHIVALLTGDSEFDQPAVVASLALMCMLVILSTAANVWLFTRNQRHQRKNETRADARKHGSKARTKRTLPPMLPRSLNPIRLRLWHTRNRIGYACLQVIAVGFCAAVALKALPAFFTTSIVLPCVGTETIPARAALLAHLGLNTDTLSGSDSRALNKLLLDGDESVRCGDRIAAGHQLDSWYKTRWLPFGTNEAPQWASELRAVLVLDLRPSVLWVGDSSYPTQAGMGHAIVGTLYSMILMTAAALLGIFAAVYLHFYLQEMGRWGQHTANWIEVVTRVLLSIPIIGFGIIGHAIYIQWLGLARSSGWVVGPTLGLIAFPYITLMATATLTGMPGKKQTYEAAIALGMTPLEAIYKCVLPPIVPALTAAVVFGIMHAVGETAALIPVGSNAFITDITFNPARPMTTLPMQIYQWSKAPEASYQNLAALATLTLILLCYGFSKAAFWIAHRHDVEEKRYKTRHEAREGFRPI